MQIVRITILTLSPAPKAWEDWSLECGLIHLHTEPLKQASERSLRMLAIAGVEATDDALSIVADRCVEVKANVRESLESALIDFADLISISTFTSSRLASPDPCIAAMPESDAERQWLDTSLGFRHKGNARTKGSYKVDCSDEIIQGLSDRLDGVRMIAEALRCAHPLGQYRELIRFFELAFRRPITQIDKKLNQFLSGSGFGYSRDEIMTWIELRHAAVHGDNGQLIRLAYSMDAVLLVDRMLQASYDVLLNKVHWHDPSRDRRRLWSPSTATMDRNGGLQFTKGKEGQVTFTMFDEFCAFPSALGGIRLPDKFWYKRYVASTDV